MERLTTCVGYQNGNPIYKTNIDMRRIGSVDKLKNALGHYEDLGYTAEELKLCFNPPNVLYIIGSETDGERVQPIYPVDSEQVEFASGDVYWNCRDAFGDYVEIPLGGLHKEYFLTSEEAYIHLKMISI